ncbi:MAG: hypothetical protein ABSH01_13500 [Terriglobia bacterium]|jgi:hypothetical protein
MNFDKKTARKLSIVFTALAISVPILTAILNKVPDLNTGMWSIDRTKLIDVGPNYMRVIGGTFTWRFFEWQIIGSNNVPIGSGGEVLNFVNIFNPTLFHVFLLFIIIAVIAQRRSVRA